MPRLWGRLPVMRQRGPRRRFNLHAQHDPVWQDRAVVAVQLLREHRPDVLPGTVADLGCGNGRVRELLPEAYYRGFDVEPQAPDVTAHDLNQGPPEGSVDVAFVLGVLEYLDDPAGFLSALRSFASTAVVSYVPGDSLGPVDSSRRAKRRAREWLHDHSASEVEAMLVAAGFTVVARSAAGRNHVVVAA